MTKFHITKKGEPASCGATTRACPLGGEHFDSMEEASVAAMDSLQDRLGEIDSEMEALDEQEAASKARVEALESEGATEHPYPGDSEYSRWANESVGLTHADVAQGLINDAEHEAAKRERLTDSLGHGESGEDRLQTLIQQHNDGDVVGVQDAIVGHMQRRGYSVNAYKELYPEFKRLANEQASPPVPQEWQSILEADKREAVLKTYGKTDPEAIQGYLARPEIEAMTMDKFRNHMDDLARNAGAHGGHLPIGDRGRRGGNNGPTKAEKELASEVASVERKARVAQILASNADSHKEAIQHRNEKALLDRKLSDLKDQQAAHKAGRAHSAGKELDPAMIEALKMKFMKKFKIPFEESGLSVGELLQMAQKGEL